MRLWQSRMAGSADSRPAGSGRNPATQTGSKESGRHDGTSRSAEDRSSKILFQNSLSRPPLMAGPASAKTFSPTSLIIPNKTPRSPEANHPQELRAWIINTCGFGFSTPCDRLQVRMWEKDKTKRAGTLWFPPGSVRGISREKSSGHQPAGVDWNIGFQEPWLPGRVSSPFYSLRRIFPPFPPKVFWAVFSPVSSVRVPERLR